MHRDDRPPARPHFRGPTAGPSESRRGETSNDAPRRQLDALFADTPRHAPGEAGGARRHNRMPSKLHLRRERLRLARDPQEIREAADQFLQHHQLPPDDVEILLKMLQHPDEPVLRMVMSELSSLIYQGRLHNGLLLMARLDELALLPDLQDTTRDLMLGLREQAKQLQARANIKP